MYSAVTRGIEVSVEPVFMPERMDTENRRYFWAYQVTIVNRGDLAVRLLGRYWRITDGEGRVEEVRGEGVVGEQPYLSPGDSYSYTSGCPLSTPSGIMEGSYLMIYPSHEEFEVRIPAFSLDLPDGRRTVN